MSLTESTEDTEKRGIMGVKKGIYLTPVPFPEATGQAEITKDTEKDILERKKLCASVCSVRGKIEVHVSGLSKWPMLGPIPSNLI